MLNMCVIRKLPSQLHACSRASAGTGYKSQKEMVTCGPRWKKRIVEMHGRQNK